MLIKKCLVSFISLCVPMVSLAAADVSVSEQIKKLEAELSRLSQQIDKQPLLGGDTTFDYGGFIKVDAMWSEYSDRLRHGGVGDDFLVPSVIATGDGSGGGDALFDAHAKTSRFWFKTLSQTSAGAIKSYIELDFNGGADERIANQASAGLRHAFLDWQYSKQSSLLAGQTWGTFFNVGALPEAVDFIGPTSGTLFNRQLQLRWTQKIGQSGSIMLAAENPSSGFNDGGSGITGNNFDHSTMPDLVARLNGKAGNLSYSAATIVRDIAYDTGLVDSSTTGAAISLSGKYTLSDNDEIKFMFSQGNLGRYIALNAFRDGVILANGDIDLIDVAGGFIAYKHRWNARLRSTVLYAASKADNPATAINDLTKTVSNSSINLLYSPTKKLTLGGEYIHAERETESGVDGDLSRFQLMAKWVF